MREKNYPNVIVSETHIDFSFRELSCVPTGQPNNQTDEHISIDLKWTDTEMSLNYVCRKVVEFQMLSKQVKFI